jgi:hypothetical protein
MAKSKSNMAAGFDNPPIHRSAALVLFLVLKTYLNPSDLARAILAGHGWPHWIGHPALLHISPTRSIAALIGINCRFRKPASILARLEKHSMRPLCKIRRRA